MFPQALKYILDPCGFPQEVLVFSFCSRGLVNDGLYAETYSQSRWSSSSWGPRRIKKVI